MSTCDWILLLLGTSLLLYMFFREGNDNRFDPFPRYGDRNDGKIVFVMLSSQILITVVIFAALYLAGVI